MHRGNELNLFIKVFDISGQTIFIESGINTLDYTVEWGDIPAEIYVVEVSEKGRTQRYKLIRE